MKRILIVAGDPSGDLVASQLVKSLKKLEPELTVVGVGGDHIAKVSDQFLANIVKRHTLGFAISPRTILYFRNILNNVIISELKKNPPDAVIPVDFYGFNSCVAKAAKKHGSKVFYYASPQFWASRPNRAERLRSSVDLFLCLFPFELDFYKKRNIPAKFVGHPILDYLPTSDPDQPLRVEPTIGLLPGSRPSEIKRHLPVIVEACDKIASVYPGTRFLVFTVPNVPRDLYNDILGVSRPSRCLIELIQDENYRWRSQLDLAISASGMETLENALLGIPMVVMYKTNWITYAVARALIQIPHLAMPNLLAGKKIVPEFIQWEATANNIALPILHWMKDPTSRKALRKELLLLRNQFGGGGASERAARAILEKVA
ncbi:MAG: Lipid-A-disaccharide synthase [Elusimicrobia bacterium]|nr:Lipid-A-disaccharide synthase [Elusimicrobiota bacterium]